MLIKMGQGLATGILTNNEQHSIKVNNHHNKFRESVQLEVDHEANTCPYLVVPIA